MTKEWICIALFVVLGLGIAVGVLLGVTLYGKSNCAGALVVTPGDEDASHYMFLDLTQNPDTLARQEFVLLRVKTIKPRENHRA